MIDYYQILGVEPDATPETIQEKFRFLAQAFHPDKYSNSKQKQLAEEEFKKINSAYQVLSNLRKRADYDQKRRGAFNYSNAKDVSRRTEEDIRQRVQKEQRRKAEESARQRAQEEIAEREEQRKRSKEWIYANQTRQKGARLRGIDLRNLNLERANFEDADLRDANLNGSALFYAKLAGADLTNSKLIYAWLSSPIYKDTRAANATKAIFRGASLKYARLSHVDFSDAILENADFTNAIMYSVNFNRAHLKDANLTGATLLESNFTDANLIGANFKSADLEDANLTGAILDGTNFEGTLYTQNTIWPKGFNPKGTNAILKDRYYYYEQTKKSQKTRVLEEVQQEKDKVNESHCRLPPRFPAAQYRKLKSALGLLSNFTYTTAGNNAVGVNPTEYSTITLIGTELSFTELMLSIDYVNENSFYWLKYVGELIQLFFPQFDKEVQDWHRSQLDLRRDSLSDIQSEKQLGDCLISFRSNHREGKLIYSFKRVE